MDLAGKLPTVDALDAAIGAVFPGIASWCDWYRTIMGVDAVDSAAMTGTTEADHNPAEEIHFTSTIYPELPWILPIQVVARRPSLAEREDPAA